MSEQPLKGTIYWSGAGKTGNFLIGNYPSGEPMINFPRASQVDKVLLRPGSMLDLMGGLFFVDALLERGQAAPELILPFVPGARQDRLNEVGDFLFTAKSIAKEINARNFRKVTVFDPHSEVISALLDRCHVVHADECYALVGPDSYSAVISPDAGAEKRAGAVAKRLGLPLLHGWKTRDVATGGITGFGLEPTEHLTHGSISYSRVLVVDDICDGGGTFNGLAAVLKERNLKADLYVTHGIFSQGTKKLLENYGTLLCTDSIDGPKEGVRVINVCGHYIEGMV